ncbi:hypothetical protein DIPPA_21369 [Diplonema papillatum]|nr:hypothetical protein DIPPA_21369 [Diplonema papillatum]
MRRCARLLAAQGKPKVKVINDPVAERQEAERARVRRKIDDHAVLTQGEVRSLPPREFGRLVGMAVANSWMSETLTAQEKQAKKLFYRLLLSLFSLMYVVNAFISISSLVADHRSGKYSLSAPPEASDEDEIVLALPSH